MRRRRHKDFISLSPVRTTAASRAARRARRSKPENQNRELRARRPNMQRSLNDDVGGSFPVGPGSAGVGPHNLDLFSLRLRGEKNCVHRPAPRGGDGQRPIVVHRAAGGFAVCVPTLKMTASDWWPMMNWMGPELVPQKAPPEAASHDRSRMNRKLSFMMLCLSDEERLAPTELVSRSGNLHVSARERLGSHHSAAQQIIGLDPITR
jgi:hypothetical protein